MYDMSIINNKESYAYFLNYFTNYNLKDFSIDVKYCYYNKSNDQGLRLIFDKYNPLKIVNNMDDFYASLKLMEWTFNHLLHSKECHYSDEQFTISIIEFSKKNNVSLNCLCHATVLTELLLCLGYKAKKVFCLSCDVLPSENHVVVNVFIESLNKWIMLDPSTCCYITDVDNKPLSIGEVRASLMQKSKINICYYNKFRSRFLPQSNAVFSEDDYIAYLYKDFFRFVICASQHSNYIKVMDDYFMLVPDGYLISGLEIHNYAGHQCLAKLTTNSNIFWG